VSRFDASRRNRILVWTGAALAWGTAATMAGHGPVTTNTGVPLPPDPVAADAPGAPAMPQAPSGGLVVIRYQPSDGPAGQSSAVGGEDITIPAGSLTAGQVEAPSSVPTPVSSGS